MKPFAELFATRAKALQDFWSVYEAQQEALRNALTEVAEAHTPFTPEALERMRGAVSGDWEPYVTNLHHIGALYAERGVPFSTFSNRTRVVCEVIGPALVKTFGAQPGRLGDALNAMSALFHHTLAIVAEQYIATKDSGANAFLDSIVENIPNMVFVKDAADLRFVRFNKAGEDLLGVPRADLIGKNDYDFFPKEQADFFVNKDRQVLVDKKLTDIAEEPIETKHGKRWLHTKKIPIADEAGVPRYLLGISEDITERKEMIDQVHRMNDELERRVIERTNALRDSEEQLRQSQKMEAIGRLAGGVAHDFNNLLSVILSYGEMIASAVPKDNELQSEIAEIRRAAQRASDLTRQLLAFSRQQVLAPKVTDLNQVLSGMDRMLTRLIGEDIEVRTRTTAHLDMVMVDPNQMEQVVMNLVVNARDAMPAGGMLTLETANVELDEIYAADHVGVTPGPHVMMAITDNGIGMNKETLARIFEPFFTTKPTGKGTGLGLSTVFGIVKQSGGHVWVYSEEGKGTTFKIYFPRTESGARKTGSPVRVAPPRGHETILLVEDEDQVRTLAKKILERQGYVVHASPSGLHAITFLESHTGPIDLLLTDVIMPKMSGRELAEKVAILRPSTKVLFMSGYTDDAVVHHGVLDSGIAFIQKPITPDTLSRKVREVLDPET